MWSLNELLREPALGDCDVDGSDRLRVHSDVLRAKPMLRDVFTEIHGLFVDLDCRFFSAPGARVELGAGVFPLRETERGVFATDVVRGRRLDCVADACALPFHDGSLRALYAQNAFHHFPDPRGFFSELRRVVAPGGGAILLEPFHGPLASLLYPVLFASESFDKGAAAWEMPSTGPMTGANQALSYIVFERDRARFEADFPDLRIAHSEPLRNHLRYLLSGGLNFRQLVPDWSVPLLRVAERVLAPLAPLLALHHVTVIVRSR